MSKNKFEFTEEQRVKIERAIDKFIIMNEWSEQSTKQLIDQIQQIISDRSELIGETDGWISVEEETGIGLMAKERKEQVEKHGRTIALDVFNNRGYQLSNAAQRLIIRSNFPPEGWDRNIWEKMFNKPRKEYLVIAGALLAAEIDRLIALEKQQPLPSPPKEKP